MSDSSLAWRPCGHVLQALPRVAGADVAAALAAIAEPAPHSLRRAGVDWLIVGQAALRAADLAEKARRVAQAAWLIDQSHGRRRLLLCGPQAARRLARGVGVDLARLPVGASCETQYAAIAVHITRTGGDAFEVLVGASFAQNLWDALGP